MAPKVSQFEIGLFKSLQLREARYVQMKVPSETGLPLKFVAWQAEMPKGSLYVAQMVMFRGP